MFYGLMIDDEIVAVIKWTSSGKPTIFDFNWHISSQYSYDVVPVTVIPNY